MNSRGEGTVSVIYDIPEGYHQIDNRALFYFALDDNNGFELGEIVYPPARNYGSFEGWEGKVELTAPLRGPKILTEAEPVSLFAGYQLCDEQGTCFRPVKESMISQGTIAPIEKAATSRSLPLFLLFAFLGGIILNIMPCVLPVLSLKALHLVGQSGDSRKKILLNSLSYTGGIIVSLLILGLIVIAVKASGTALGWGFQFQNPLFVLILTSLVFLFSLSLFEVFFINPPRRAGEAASKQKGGYGGSFLTGIMAVLLATPCTAPLLGSALGFAFVQPGGVILIFFFLIGLGLALPFILLGFSPSLVNKLPKPGEWMNRFREIMGFLLAGTAVYLLTVLHSQTGSRFSGVLWFMLVLAAASWLYGRGQRSARKTGYAHYAAALILLGGGMFFVGDLSEAPPQSAQLEKSEETVPFSPEQVEALRAEDRPLFLEFTADWCATCRTNHLTVLDRGFRKALFEEEGIVYMVGDYTLNDDVIGSWLTQFDRAGVPLYVYYPPGEDPRILPEILTRKILEESIRGR
ncbi:MAG: thioredoxin family protein [Spirochaetales bacterium]|nr:thioredoxin family protein [Spirochaetales bacterium]